MGGCGGGEGCAGDVLGCGWVRMGEKEQKVSCSRTRRSEKRVEVG